MKPRIKSGLVQTHSLAHWSHSQGLFSHFTDIQYFRLMVNVTINTIVNRSNQNLKDKALSVMVVQQISLYFFWSIAARTVSSHFQGILWRRQCMRWGGGRGPVMSASTAPCSWCPCPQTEMIVCIDRADRLKRRTLSWGHQPGCGCQRPLGNSHPM